MRPSFTKRVLRLSLVSLFTVVWASTPAVAQRYFSYDSRFNSSGFSLFGNSNLWDALRHDLNLKHDSDRPFVNQEIRWLSAHQQYLDRTTSRAAPYLYYIYDQIKKRNLPGELALLPVIESAYNPFALSNKGAAGIWQFMPGTAKLYGLTLNPTYDGRRDIVESTRAALDYLTYLHKEFHGDWLLAIAAYNSGPGQVKAAMEHNRRLGKGTDFWSLPLPDQTKHYVPRLIALAKVVKSPDNYDVQLSPIRNAPYFAQVDVNERVNLAQIAEDANLDVAQIHALNAGFKRSASSSDTPSRLLLPIKAISKFNLKQGAQADSASSSGRFIKAWVGDRFSSSAEEQPVKLVETIKDSLTTENTTEKLEENTSVLTKAVAVATQVTSTPKEHKTVSLKRITHTVKHGETVYALAQQYHLSSSQISKWNHFSNGHKLSLGESVVLWISQ